MKRNNVLRSTQGFTLVELAIVLVIIGLIIAGVLKGRELIYSSKAKNVGLQMKSVESAAPLYREKNPAVPFATISTARLVSAGFLTGTGGPVNKYGGEVYISQSTTTTPLAIVSKGIPGDIAKMVDEQLDDGNPSTGSVRVYATVPFVAGVYPTGILQTTADLEANPTPQTDITMTFTY